jgi:hypothetical protein
MLRVDLQPCHDYCTFPSRFVGIASLAIFPDLALVQVLGSAAHSLLAFASLPVKDVSPVVQ